MYTYESFVTDGSFTLLQPVFYSFLLAAVLLLIFVLTSKARGISGTAVVFISLILIIISGQVLIFDAIIADELGLGGDGTASLLFLGIAVLSLVSPVLFFIRKKEG
ncbi:hypothetical protein [Cytobacillus firmus]|uniref:hypothetical protein n=1 Tax=Cytobacillus firmus TaxID=1399 RepID=UPI001C8EE65A|nr:hypothetical protein [Cytobacillus firmus]MBX9974774.1 hypothetical protein [Cytobacillus firmus]